MSGAQAYTTSRGKNKKRKEGVRKDHKNNGERSLKTKQKNHSAFAETQKEKITVVAGHLMGGGATGVSSVHTKIKENPQKALILMREKCNHSQCTKTRSDPGVTLRDCSVCHAVKYCSRECQVSAWKEGHGKICKTLKEGGPLAIEGAAAAAAANTDSAANAAAESSDGDEDEDEDSDDEDSGSEDGEGEGDGPAEEAAPEGEKPKAGASSPSDTEPSAATEAAADASS